MAEVQYVGASRIYPGNPVPAVNHLDLDITDGEFMVLVGPSGSGKSTALRMLAGLEDVDEGEIRISGKDVSNKPPKDRDIAMVFQNYALYPHMTVADNMGFALKLKGVNKSERDAKVLEAAKLLDLERFLDRKPKALSGGQRQRVAMGRAIVRSPAVFLMDEPLSNLDAKLRVETRANIAALQARLGTTTIYVTHDQIEAMTMGHRVAVLKDGILQQVDTPRALYDRPGNSFVAGFIGSPAMNLKTVPLVEGGTKLGGLVVPLRREVASAAAAAGLSSVTLGIRPEAFDVATCGWTSPRSSAPTRTCTAPRSSTPVTSSSSSGSTASTFRRWARRSRSPCWRARNTPSTRRPASASATRPPRGTRTPRGPASTEGAGPRAGQRCR
jgi:multiple sugar transport system ATP-binding protein